MKIFDVLKDLSSRPIPVCRPEASMEEIIRLLKKFPHTRLVYVTDKENKLLGVISVSTILHHIFPYHYHGEVHHRGLLKSLTSENAEHMMIRHYFYLKPEEDISAALQRMSQNEIKEAPVLDDSGYIIGDIKVIDLLTEYY